MNVNVHACMCTYRNMHVCMYVYVYILVCACIYLHGCVCTLMCVYALIDWMCTYVHIDVFVYMHRSMCVHE